MTMGRKLGRILGKIIDLLGDREQLFEREVMNECDGGVARCVRHGGRCAIPLTLRSIRYLLPVPR